nr:VCBS domain-containing protein [Psychrobacter sp. PraFG1]UNK05579.1 VCBS domain-containing protein [Psychrobacter sp. PraFG1]
MTKRVGNDLHVSMEDNAQDSDLIIEGFYDDTNSALIGLAEDGEYYYYVPDSGEVVDYVTQLQVGDIEGQALGGESQVAPWWVGATEGSFDTLPWLVGLAGAGIVGAALSSGGGSSSSNGYVPPVDNNKKVDDLVKAAEEAEKAAEDALVEANKDGLITPEENQNLTDLNNAVTEAKDKAQAKVDELPESTGKDSFQDRLDVIDGIVVPGITDQDKDGLDDTLQAEVEDLVKAAEEAEKAAEDTLVEANKDGLITPEENQNLTDLNNAVTEAKDKAQAKVDELPESTGKDSFQDRLDVIDGIVVPGITDQDKDGLDDTLQAEVEDLVKAAEEAEKAAEDALVEANKDGLITPEENQNLTDLNNAVTEAKDKAQAKVDELPESTGKDSFQDRLDVIDGIVVPGITDQDKDGLDDTLQAEVEDLVKAAEEAEKAAEDALVEANKDGLITPEENQNLTDLNNAVTEAKDKAQAKVDELPESTGKDSFQDRLDVIDGIVVPGITDQDKDGLDDTLQAEVEDLVKAAEEAEKAAEDALVEANKDGLITPEENQNLTDLNNAVTEAKDKAQAKVDELPESTGKDSFQDRLDVIDGIVVPGITDQDKDGLDDTLQAEVEDLVKAAEEAEKAAEDALVEANKDGLITPEENQNLTDLNNAVTEAKDKAQAKVDELPESTGKDSFQDRLDVIDGIVVPGITDQDKDGLDDTLQAEVEDLVKAAEEAEKAAEDALVEANKDGLITPEENQNLTDLNNAVTEAKDKAQAKVDELPESTGKDSFQDRLDVIDGIVVPGITDQDKDGLDDTLQAEVEDLVKAAEEAEKAAEDALVEANKDGLITPEENQNLTDLNNAVTEAKDKAQAKVDELPESTGKDSFQDRLDVIDGIVVPGITDQDKDGLDDTLQAEVEDLVKAAEEAEKAAEDALVEANKDGLITPEENQNLTDLNNAVTEAKDKAQAKVDELPESTGKDSFQDRLDVIDGIVVPGITDQDKDGLDDTLQAEVEDLVKAAEEAEKAAEDALVEANKDGLITPEENQNLTDLNNAVTEAKDKAQAKVDELPESTGKDSFQDRLDVIDGIVVPGITDQDKDGLDDTLQAEVEDLVKAAEEAEKAAEDALVEANKDGLITPEENQNLTDLNNAVTEAKDKAQAKVDELPESTGKDSFQDRLDVIDGIVVPGITDQDKDGLDDTLQAEVEDLVKAAEEAEKAAEDALVEANKDGLITPEENQNLTDLNNAVTEAKDKAQAKVDELPESTGKDSFQDRLDVIDGIVVPGITDQDKDGLDDTLQAEVEDLVKAAEEAEKAAEDALVEANKDGLITPEENQNLTDLNNAVTEAKDKAQAKVDELPESTGKDSFQDRLDVIDGIVVPGITDQDKDGLDDTLQAEVEDLVKAAEEAEKAAEDALVEANKDGLITPEENQNLTDLNNAVTEAKDKAQAKVDELPESTGKDSFQDRLDVIDGIVVPGITDQDKDGLDDTLQAEVEDLVKAAEEAEKAAEDALVEANKDGLITPEENQNLTDLNNAVTEAKDKAQAKVDELPESTGKDSFQDRLDVIDGIVVPGITDQDKDGLDDTLQAEVEDLVKAAEEAEKAAEDALVEANKDGLITPEENQNLTDLNNAVTEAKDKAQAKVDELPESTGKDSFQDRLDVIDGIVVPGITDQDKDGLDDTLQAEVEDLVKAAEEAEKAAEDALVEANKDGLITPEENQNLTDLNNAVTEAKDKAQAKVDELPESTGKDSFQDRLDVIDGIVVPGITDQDKDGLDDTLQAEVEDLVKAAEEAEKAAEDALVEANKDGLITPEENQNLTDLNNAVTEAKDKAQAKVDELPESTGKDSFQDRLDVIDGIVVPGITDQDKDGLDDTLQAEVEDLVKAAEEAEKAAEDALVEANKDGLITPEENQNLTDLNNAVTEAKDKAQAKVDELPESTGKDSFQDRLDVIDGIVVPGITDQDKDGLDDTLQAEVEDLVKAAEEAEKAAEDALVEANKDGLITPEENQNLTDLNNAVTEAKDKAQAKVDELPESTGKDSFQDRLDVIDGIVVPGITDQDKDGLDDTLQAEVEDLVKAAEEAEKAAEDALVEANKDGLITPEENQNLTDLNNAVTEAKDKAQAKVDELPESTGKDSFQDRLDVIDGIVVPGITDQDKDGLDDTLQAEVEDLVKAAEEAEKAAEDALVEANKDGLITPEENQNLTDLNNAVTEAKDKAQAKVDELPESTGKDSFQDRLDVIDGIVVPGITDQDKDGLDDTLQAEVEDLVKAAEEAEKAAEDALVEANKDGLITPEENQNLTDLNNAVTEAKDKAQAKVDELPESTGKDSFQDRLDVIDGIVVPGITDQDKDGLDDTLQAEVEDLVKAAEEAEKAAEDALVEANKDGLITPEENQNLTDLNNAVTEAKDKAQAKVDELPESTGKDSFQDRLDVIDGIVVPGITDQDKDGLDDTLQAEVEDLVKAAEEAEKAAEDALVEANKDGLITPEENQNLTDLNNAVTEAKDKAQAKVDELPESTGKDSFQDRLDVIDGIVVPGITDQDKDGLDDTLQAEVEDLVKAAEEAEKAAEDALVEANKDGLITPEENQNLTDLNNAVTEAKDKAQAKVDELPESTGKDSFQDRLDVIDGIVVPGITDQDKDGLDDTLQAEVEDLVKAAEEAEKAAEDALVEANKDGLITPEENQNLTDLNNAVTEAKDKAQAKVDELPESTGKDSFQDRLDVIDGIVVPGITDQDKDGLDDTLQAEVEDLVKAAEEAEKAAEDALVEANKDGLITPEENQNLTDLNNAVTEAKDKAQAKVDELPESTGKDSFQDRLDVIDGIVVPGITDQDKDGLDDTLQAEVEDLVKAAEEAEKAAEDALVEANKDGLITPEENQNLTDLNNAVTEAKDKAQAKVDELPESTGKDSFQDRLDVIDGIVVPGITDQDKDGLDDTLQAEVEDLVKAAEEAEKAAEDALVEANKDGLITPEENQNLTDLNNAVTEAKDKAQAKVDELPESTGKDSFQDRLDVIDGIVVPGITDQDKDGLDDTLQAEVEDLVKAAEEAEKAAEDALVEANKDGLITPEENQNLTDLNNAVTEAKDKAQAKVDELPESTGKDSFQDRLDVIDGIVVPGITDQDKDGLDDTLQAEVEDLVKAAEEAEKAAEDALVEANKDGLITPEENQNLTDLNNAVTEAKDKAQAKVDELPESTGKDSFQDRLDVIDGIVVPGITDQDKDGLDDTLQAEVEDLVKAAEEAEKAAEDALVEANKDGLITPEENQNLTDLNNAVTEAKDKAQAKVDELPESTGKDSFQDRLDVIDGIVVPGITDQDKDGLDDTLQAEVEDLVKAAEEAEKAAEDALVEANKDGLITPEENQNLTDLNNAVTEAKDKAQAKVDELPESTGKDSFQDRLDVIDGIVVPGITDQDKDGLDDTLQAEVEDLVKAAEEAEKAAEDALVEANKDGLITPEENQNLTDLNNAVTEAKDKAQAKVDELPESTGKDSFQDRLDVIDGIVVPGITDQDKDGLDDTLQAEVEDLVKAAEEAEKAAEDALVEANKDGLITPEENQNLTDLNNAVTEAKDKAQAKVDELPESTGKDSFQDRLDVIDGIVVPGITDQDKDGLDDTLQAEVEDLVKAAEEAEKAAEDALVEANKDGLITPEENQNLTDLNNAVTEAKDKAQAKVDELPESTGKDSFQDRLDVIDGIVVPGITDQDKDGLDDTLQAEVEDLVKAAEEAEKAAEDALVEANKDGLITPEENQNLTDLNNAVTEAKDKAQAKVDELPESTGKDSFQDRLDVIDGIVVPGITDQDKDGLDDTLQAEVEDLVKAAEEAEKAAEDALVEANKDGLITPEENQNLTDLNNAVTEAKDKAQAKVDELPESTGKDSFQDRLDVIDGIVVPGITDQDKDGLDDTLQAEVEDLVKAAEEAEKAAEDALVEANKDGLITPEENQNLTDLNNAVTEAKDKAQAKVDELPESTGKDSFQDRLDVIDGIVVPGITDQDKDGLDDTLQAEVEDLVKAAEEAEKAAEDALVEANKDGLITPEENQNLTDLNNAVTEAKDKAQAKVDELPESTGKDSFQDRLDVIDGIVVPGITDQDKDGLDDTLQAEVEDLVKAAEEAEKAAEDALVEANKDGLITPEENQNLTDLNNAVTEAKDKAQAKVDELPESTGKDSFQDRLDVIDGIVVPGITDQDKDGLDDTLQAEVEDLVKAAEEAEKAAEDALVEANKDGLITPEENQNLTDLNNAVTEAKDKAQAKVDELPESTGKDSFQDRLDVIDGIVVPGITDQDKDGLDDTLQAEVEDLVKAAEEAEKAAEDALVEANKDGLITPEENQNLTDLNNAVTEAKDKAQAKVDELPESTGKDSFQDRLDVIDGIVVPGITDQDKDGLDDTLQAEVEDLVKAAEEAEKAAEDALVEANKDGLITPEENQNLTDLNNAVTEAKDKAQAKVDELPESTGKDSFQDRLDVIDGIVVPGITDQDKDGLDDTLQAEVEDLVKAAEEAEKAAEDALVEANKDGLITPEENQNLTDLNNAVTEAKDKAQAKVDELPESTGKDSFQDRLDVIDGIVVPGITDQDKDGLDDTLQAEVEDLVKAAEEAEKAAEDALVEANKDGLITPEENQNLTDLNNAVTEAKDKAQAKVDELPESTGKDSFQDRLDVIDGIVVPGITDQDKDGLDDTLQAEVEDLVKAAEEAEKAAEDALVEANKDGLITPEENQNLTDLNNAVTEAKDKAQAKVDELPESTGKDSFQDRLDVIDGIVVPGITDQDKDGLDDTLQAEVEDLVKAAEEAEKAAEDALVEANKDGLITPEENQNLTDLNNAVTEAKDKAQAKVDELPESTGKDSFQDRLDVIDGIVVPGITDQDKDGLDDTLQAEVEDLVKAAEEAEKAAEDALVEANKDGLITPEENQNLTDLNNAVTEAKDKAQAKVDELPESTGKDSFQDRLDVIDGIVVPGITDQDKDGLDDTLQAEVEDLVKAAEEAEKAAEDALVEANKDGLITPEENQNLTDLNNAVTEAKDKAQAKVDELPESTGKDSFQDRLDVIDGIVVPGITDQDKDGLDDTLQAEVEDLVKAAEEAEKAAEDALVEANKDGLITPEENQNLTDLNNAVTEAKDKAQAKVDELPESTGKDSFQDRLDVIDGIVVPGITDQDKDGLDDTLQAEVEDLVKAAEEAEKAAEDALVEANKDGLITPEENQNLTDLNNAVTEAKDKAQAKVDELPESTGKDSFQDRLDVIDGIVVPGITDQDKDGLDDTLQAEVEDLVKAAEEAEKAAEDALVEANKDGLITPEENQNLTDLNNAVTEAKDKAQAKVDELPESTGKDSFQDRLDVIDGIVVPGITDQDKDGLDDTLQAEVEDLVKAAEEAEKAAEDALVEANKDGLITPEENQNLTDLNNAVTEAKDKAQAKVDELPESTGKDSFQDRLDVIDGIVVPGITDQDKDGLDDTLQAEVEDLVKAAEEAEKAAEDALVEANKDGLITPEENQNLTDLNNAVTEAKDKAQAKVDELPESTGKDSFQDRLDVIDGIVVPGITDQDKDGLDDTLQAEVEDLVKAAEEAEKAAEDALVEANKDGLITPEENQNLTDLNNAVTEAKDKAQAKVDELPESTGKDSFQDRLDVIDGIVVPGITDQDKDGLDDTLQAEVEDLVKAAEEAEKAAEDALVEANKDGLITPEENQNLTDLNNAVTEAKDKAQAKVDELPESTGKDSFQDRLDVIDGIVVPGITDQDKDGLDDTLQAEVEDLVKAAEEAEKAAEDALVEANKDGLITPEENQNLTDLNNAVTEAKDKAQAKVDELPESTGKDSFQDRLDVIDGIVVPGITDQDKDGLDDTLQAEVEDLVKAAEEAEKAAEDALVEANKDGLITPEENQNLTDLNNAVTEAKDKAQAKVDELPESTGKDSFQDRLDVIDGIVVPGITDQDKDGLDDTLQAEVEDLVKAAEEAEKAAEDALVEANKDGLITPEENQNLTDLNNAVTEAKDKAQAKVDELPESTGKDSFQDRLDVIDGIVVPGITDQDKDGLDDTLQAEVEDLVKAAEEAEKAAEDALVEANKDGLITPEENQNLTDLNNAVTEAKDKAQAKVDELPESTGKDSFQDRLDVIDGIVVPGITDQDKDGLDDTLQAEVEDLVKAAEEAEKAAEDALVEANKDGLITPEENQNLTDLNNAVTEAKDKAQAKVDELPESTGKDSFQDRLDVIDGIVVPGITDQDKDGLDDTLQAEVEDLVKAAEEAEKAAEDALVEANKDGLITPEENQNLTDLNNAVTEAKDKAQAKVDELPESTGKDSFQDRLDVIDGIVVPGITDQDKDGLDDTLQAEVEDLVKAAEEAEKAAEDALVEANKDGLITPEENQNLTDLNNAVTEAKDKAQAKVDELPESTGKDSFQDRLDVIDGIVVPGITDQDKENNPATVTDAQGAVVEDAAETTISGTVTITDLDEGEAFAQPQTKQGAYGTFSVNENGNWSYALDNGKPEVQALREGQTVEDIFTVTSKDGTGTGTVTVTITGTNDQPKLDVVDIVDIVTEIYQGYVDTSMSIADANGSDIDEGDVLTYSLPDNNQGYFAIDESTGVITLTEAGVDYINAGNDLPSQLTIMVSDNSGANNDSITQIIDLPATILATRVVFVEVTDDSNEEVENLPANQNSAYGVNGVYTGIVANNSDGSVQTDPAVLQGLTNDTTPTITVTRETTSYSYFWYC